MPEEKKKDSFTFSDKIKNSKPAASSKSFANRISSKVGSDGKPRKTLFERTKRDAPFFIAALVALLLLPFLYKYSGSVSEEPVITPASEDSVFDPERYGFDTVTAGDPEGQIAALSGRDPLSLIKGWGKEEETVNDDYSSSLPEFSRDGFDERDSRSSSYNEVETNNTNIYKKAPAATRAAFRRAATKINPLGSAGLNSRGGGKLAVGMWGGGMKKAANKVTGPASPTNSPKPVSLQPLQAAGKPSRSYFGQGAAKEARRSKDAMSKANAMQALADAQVRAIEPGKIGGLLGGEGSGPGGGAANLKRDFSYKGEKPWWWDMMKQRSQMLWERDLKRKWAWEDWGDNLIRSILGTIGTGMANCLITGNSDGDPDTFLGTGGGVIKEATCCGKKKNKIGALLRTETGLEFGKEACDNYKTKVGSEACPDGWKDARDGVSGGTGFFGTRINCLGGGWLTAKAKGWFSRDGVSLEEASDCTQFARTGQYTASFRSQKGKEGKWDVYHYVVGVPVASLQQYYTATPVEQEGMLEVIYFNNFASDMVFNTDIPEITGRKTHIPLFVESVAIKNKKVKDVKFEKAEKVENTCSEHGVTSAEYNLCRKMEVEGHFSNISVQGKDGKNLTYKGLKEVLRQGGAMTDVTTMNGKAAKFTVSTKKAKEGKGWIISGRCQYPLARVSCNNYATMGAASGPLTNNKIPYAHIQFSNGMKGSQNNYEQMKDKFLIAYHVQGNNETYAKALSDDTKNGPQFHIVPHQPVEKFNTEWKTADKGTGYFTNQLGKSTGKEKDGFQVLATSKEVLNNMKGENSKRVVLTWQVIQCEDILIDGSGLSKGRCVRGTSYSGKTDDQGNITERKAEGTDLPGTYVVSEATCVYEDGQLMTGFEDEVADKKDVPPPPPPLTQTTPKKEISPTQKEIFLSGTVRDINGKYTSAERGQLQFPSITDKLSSCMDLDSSGISSKELYEQKAVDDYVKNVVRDVNASTQFNDQQPASVKRVLAHTGSYSVAHLVDAMTLDYSLNQSAMVPKNVVCALGKTIGALARDPHVNKPVNNMFGAFAAYIDEESSFFPARLNAAGEQDWRFIGCRDNISTQNPQIHYGYYNWNQEKFGDLGYGKEGRDGFLKSLRDGGWNSFPLRDLAKQLDKNVTLTQIKQVNGTIDDVVRQRYVALYKNVFNPSQSCDYSGDMKVEDALKYVNLVCKNGSRAKPTNGATDCNRNRFKASTVTGN